MTWTLEADPTKTTHANANSPTNQNNAEKMSHLARADYGTQGTYTLPKNYVKLEFFSATILKNE